MIRNRLLLKTLTVFFILEMLISTVLPTVSWALTAGPTAPEATSFEPVDTTDMVNTITGDFVYNMPLLEVPGPSGSYPLSLSYHAGIKPNYDASWVGLGWSLNTGAINRMVNGIPDDFNDAKTIKRSFWEGGETNANTFGISVGIGNVATVSSGLTFANDTYRGRGVGGYAGLGLGFNISGNVGASVDLSLSKDAYGNDLNSSIGIGVGVGGTEGAVSGSARIGASINNAGKISAGLGGGVSSSHSGRSFLDASISTDNKKGSLGISGTSTTISHFSNGKIRSSDNHFAIDIPLWYGVNLHLARDYTRYWMNHIENLSSFGSLYFPSNDGGDLSKKAFDTYHLESNFSLAEGQHPSKVPNGSFPDYDQYNVNAQGLGGNMRPHHYILSLSSQDILEYEGENQVKDILNYHIPQHSVGIKYSFTNDFSGRVLNSNENVLFNKTLASYSHPSDAEADYNAWKLRMEETYNLSTNIPLLFPYQSPIIGMEGYEGTPGTKRKLPYAENAPNQVASSRHIEYFTNHDIVNMPEEVRSRGFIECLASGFIREIPSGNLGSIGGFAITNASGVTYNFSLPVYSYDEYTYTQNKDTHDRFSFNNVAQSGKYAYTWYLTSVTGPDYVDRGPNGEADHILNEYDWGYWTEFQYGKWTDQYAWRNPAEDSNEDLDSRFISFSKGKKEVYYLNAVRTATHTALFVKEMRWDGKSVTSLNNESVITNSDAEVSWVDPGGFVVGNQSKQLRFAGQPNGNPTVVLESEYQNVTIPVGSLRLAKILLVKNDGTDYSMADASSAYNHAYTYRRINPQIVKAYAEGNTTADWLAENYQANSRYVNEIYQLHQGFNVIDIFDLAHNPIPESKIIREIHFNHSYSLSPGTANSFDKLAQLYSCSNCIDELPDNSLIQEKFGKLTLDAVVFKGKEGSESLPPVKFYYDEKHTPAANIVVSTVHQSSRILTGTLVPNWQEMEVGDILELDDVESISYGFILEKTDSHVKVRIISPDMPEEGRTLKATRTKNPPYNKDLIDIWGNYKVDYFPSDNNRNVARYPTEISAKNADVWSLREIHTSLGATIFISYESDYYGSTVLSENLCVPLTYLGPAAGSDPLPGHKKFNIMASLPDSWPFDFVSIGYYPGIAVSILGATYVTMPSDPSNPAPLPGQPYIVTNAKALTVTPREMIMEAVVQASTYDFYGGVLRMMPRKNQPGGGIRVKALGLEDLIKSTTRYTNYEYEFDGISSGVTSYEPINVFDLKINSSHPDLNRLFRYQVLFPFVTMLSLSREVPAPAVYYGKVRVSESIADADGTRSLPGYSIFEFETFEKGMVDVEGSNTIQDPSTGSVRDHTYHKIRYNIAKLKNFGPRLGNLKSVTFYNDDDQKVSETINHYLHDEQAGLPFNTGNYKNLTERYRHQGIIEETFYSARWVRGEEGSGQNSLMGLISKIQTFPSIQTGSTTINWKTGVKTFNRNLGFDYYTGEPVKSISSDAHGNHFVSEVIPAYHQYASMGLKVDNINNKNMLSQLAINSTYTVDPEDYSAKNGLWAMSVQTWSDNIPSIEPGQVWRTQPGIWRKHASYSYVGDNSTVSGGDGLIQITNNQLPQFNAWQVNDPVPSGWQLNTEIKLYDVYSHALEVRDLNENYAATKMSSDQTRVFATVANSSYNEFAFSGAEDDLINNEFGGGVQIADGEVVTKTDPATTYTTHTGSKSVILYTDNRQTFKYNFTSVAGKNYHASVWVNSGSGRLVYQIGSNTPVRIPPHSTKKAGAWYLISTDITNIPEGSTISVWCETTASTLCHFDDFRVHPLDAAMTSYVYNEWGELSHILDGNNLYTEYRYDEMGRLKETFTERLNTTIEASQLNAGKYKTSEVRYHYKRNTENN